MWKKTKNLLLYAGVEKKMYRTIRPDIIEINRKNMVVFSLIAIAAFLIMTAMGLLDASVVKNRPVYLASAAVCAVLLSIVAGPAKRHPNLVYAAVIVFAMVLFAFGIALGTIIEPNETSVSFPILLFAVPLLFTVSPILMNLSILAGIIAYLIAAHLTQNSVMFGYNLSNILPYGLLSMVVGTYMMTIKVNRYELAQKNKILSESDQLTGLLNRRSYEMHIQRLEQGACGKRVRVIAMDVNGLKRANDCMGHAAGDELLRGAAACIEGAFGNYGSCYRTGGDEFVVLIEGECPEETELKKMLADRTGCWKGTLVSGLSISIGISSGQDSDSIPRLIQQADAQMYANKAEYYSASQNDRRRS